MFPNTNCFSEIFIGFAVSLGFQIPCQRVVEENLIYTNVDRISNCEPVRKNNCRSS